MKYMILSLMLLLSSCTYNISMAHTEGAADDVINDTATNTPNLSPALTIPLTPASSIGISK